mgnify:CR=1 FL=1
MSDFLKVFVRGIIITLALPLIAAFFALYLVYLCVVYLVMLIRNAIVFFMGGSIMEMKQDVEAKKIMIQQNNTAQSMTETLADLMHSAIAQNPEAVQAMAQQQMAMNRAAEAAKQETQEAAPQVTTSKPLEIEATPVEEVKEND